MRGILDHPEPVLPGEGADARDVHHQPAHVDRDDADGARSGGCLRPQRSPLERRELARRVVEVHVERHRIAIDQHREGPEVTHDLGRRRKRHRRNEDRVPGLEPERLDREVKGGRRRIDGDRVGGAHCRREFLLETLDPRTGGQPARAEGRHDLRDLFLL